MDLSAIVEAFLVASEAPLTDSELARMIRTRAAELSEDSIVEVADFQLASDSAERDLNLEELAKIGEVEVHEAINRLNDFYQKSGRAFSIVLRAKGWKIFTSADYGGFVRLLFPSQKPERLSPPAMETLAIIAYRQPVTKSALEAVRGVSCDGMLQKLLDRELIKIAGRADLPGRPILYQTTELFLEHFGITTVNELPNIGELRAVPLPDGTEDKAEKKQPQIPPAETQLALSAMENHDPQPTPD